MAAAAAEVDETFEAVAAGCPRRVIVEGVPATTAGRLLLLPATALELKLAATVVALALTAMLEGETEAEGRTVLIVTPDSVSILERKLDAWDWLNVNVSVAGTELEDAVGTNVMVTVLVGAAALSDSVATIDAEEDIAVAEADAIAVDVAATVVAFKAVEVEMGIEPEMETEEDWVPSSESSESLSSSSSQSIGRSTVSSVLFTATPPVAPDALIIASAVALVVHARS